MLNDFLSHLHRGGQYAYFHALPERRSSWYTTDDPPELRPERAKTNIYFGVHPCVAIPPCNAYGEVRRPEYVRSQKAYIAAINCLFAEYDCKDYGSLEVILTHLDSLTVPAPSVLVNSGGGVHAYWLLREPFVLDSEDRREAAMRLQYAWVSLVKGDEAKDLARVLRVPGSWNYKYEPRRPVMWLKAELEQTYTLPALACHVTVTTPGPEPIRWRAQAGGSITEYNEQTDVAALLERYHYRRCGRRKMLSPYSTTGQAGVTIDEGKNRAFVHHTSDPLHDGYWKRPFDVVRLLEYQGDFRQTLAALRAGQL